MSAWRVFDPSMDDVPFLRGMSKYPDLASGLKSIPIAPPDGQQNERIRSTPGKKIQSRGLTTAAWGVNWWTTVTTTTRTDIVANTSTASSCPASEVSARAWSTAVASAQPLDLTNFHWFAKLPPEIRIMIWLKTIVPRIVSLDYEGGNAPGAMLVNRESRALFRKYYEYRGGRCHPNLAGLPRGPRFGIYINPEIDILHVNPYCNRVFRYLKTVPEEDREAVDWRDALSGHPAADWAVLWLHSGYPKLMAKIKHIAFDLESEKAAFPVRFAWSQMLQEPDCALSLVCPALKNIFVVQDNDIGTVVEDLEISNSGTLQETECMDELLQQTDAEFHATRVGVEGSLWWDDGIALKFVKRKRVQSTGFAVEEERDSEGSNEGEEDQSAVDEVADEDRAVVGDSEDENFMLEDNEVDEEEENEDDQTDVDE